MGTPKASATNDLASRLESRIVELETKLAFVEAANQELSDLVYARAVAYEQDMRRLEARLSNLQESVGATDNQDETPPHY